MDIFNPCPYLKGSGRLVICEAVFNIIRDMLNASHERCLGGRYRECPLFIHQQEKTNEKNNVLRQNA
ncbi:MAG: hypothetical protein A2052_04125 [Deltaproteobacteria bacterium GWA2_54_12]|nr:MAG: hypothetical protein A2052_04125 [Deltaproteobacteria bacterium GWA2_54_12]